MAGPAQAMTEEGVERMGAAAAARAIRDGRLSSVELVTGCLAAIDAREPVVRAWQFLDRAHALAQARAADEAHAEGRHHGLLHGVPIGIKDIFDTADMPTEDGSPLHAGRTPRADAAAVARLRAAGAVVMGKTVTTEFALRTPGKTTNPHDATRTPGGSSQGSAASVAAFMVPGAIGSQTAGSVIRPAAFCGVVGFKPSRGLIPRTGMLSISPTLDTVGVFARTLEDAGLIAECLAGFDAGDSATRPTATPPLAATAVSEPPVAPRLAFVPSPVWAKAEPETQEAFGELVEALGDAIERIDLPAPFDRAIDWHRAIMETEIAASLAAEHERGADKMSAALSEVIASGRRRMAVEYRQALDGIARLEGALDELFFVYDAFVTPAAPGPAPAGLESTGDPVFCAIWTLCGVPSVTLPLLESAAGLPIGVQLVGARGNDARLLRTARWLAARVSGQG